MPGVSIGCGSQPSERRGGRVEEAVEVGAFDPEHQAGIGAELPGPHRQRGDERPAERLGARSPAPRAGDRPG